MGLVSTQLGHRSGLTLAERAGDKAQHWIGLCGVAAWVAPGAHLVAAFTWKA
ncbi:MAG TPA: hypothetical protein VGE43_12715 [Acidimicrobiales bacterium]